MPPEVVNQVDRFSCDIGVVGMLMTLATTESSRVIAYWVELTGMSCPHSFPVSTPLQGGAQAWN